MFGHRIQSQLAYQEGENGGCGGGQKQTWEAAEGGLGDGDEGGLVLVLAIQLEGLEGADVAGDESEDGHAQSALDEDTQEGQLQELGGSVLGSGCPEEVAGPCARDVGEDDECGCEASQALERKQRVSDKTGEGGRERRHCTTSRPRQRQ